MMSSESPQELPADSQAGSRSWFIRNRKTKEYSADDSVNQNPLVSGFPPAQSCVSVWGKQTVTSPPAAGLGIGTHIYWILKHRSSCGALSFCVSPLLLLLFIQ